MSVNFGICALTNTPGFLVGVFNTGGCPYSFKQISHKFFSILCNCKHLRALECFIVRVLCTMKFKQSVTVDNSYVNRGKTMSSTYSYTFEEHSFLHGFGLNDQQRSYSYYNVQLL